MAGRAFLAAVFLSEYTDCVCKALAALSLWFYTCACTQVHKPMIECILACVCVGGGVTVGQV